VRITPDDLVAAHRLAHPRRVAHAASAWSLAVVGMLLAVVAPVDMQPWLTGCVALIVGGELARIAVDRIALPRRAARLHRQHSALHEPIDARVTDGGMEIATPTSTSRLPWSHVRRWHEGTGHMVLMQTDQLFVVLPKRDFSRADIDALRAGLERHVGPAGRRAR
jgi:hypothetical protein